MYSNEFLWKVFSLEAEKNPLFRDNHDRFPIAQAIHHVTEPIVSSKLLELGWKPIYPNDAPYAVIISHDIDFIYKRTQGKPFSRVLKDLAKCTLKGQLRFLNSIYASRQNTCELKWPVETVHEYLLKRKINSTYYFMSLKDGDQDFNYDLAAQQNILTELINSGCEVALHGGHTAYKSIDDMKCQLDELKKVVSLNEIGYRNHFLKFNLQSFDLMESAGFRTDSTLGFAETSGFRNGMAHPFRPYNHQNDSYYKLVEIPLVMMDQTLYKYMNLTSAEILDVSKKMIGKVAKVSGVFSLLWHNTNFTGGKLEDFERIIQLMRADNAWFCTSNELVDWYEKNDFFKTQTDFINSLR